MARPASRHPTELELEILKIIWRDGPSTVRQVRDALAVKRKLAHTSVITIMTIMIDKGYLTRSKKDGKHVYRAKVSRRATTRQMLKDLMARAFDGSPSAMMMNLLESSDIDAEELERVREYINEKADQESP